MIKTQQKFETGTVMNSLWGNGGQDNQCTNYPGSQDNQCTDYPDYHDPKDCSKLQCYCQGVELLSFVQMITTSKGKYTLRCFTKTRF